MMKNQIKFSL